MRGQASHTRITENAMGTLARQVVQISFGIVQILYMKY